MDKIRLTNLTIEKLTDQNSPFLEKVADWQYDWWGKRDGWSRDQVIEYIKHSICIDRVPQTYIARIKNTVVGSYQISMEDLPIRPDLYPWLVNVYVDDRHRGEGICRAMMKDCKKRFKELNIKKIYLYTKHTGLYEKYGWKYLCKTNTYKLDSPIESIYQLEIN
jgi:ribosomal protein S18 acetylase RimI-like enzyme